MPHMSRRARYNPRRLYSLTGEFMDPDPTPHPRWSNLSFR
ncbi:mgtA regulatory leader peptide MgtL [Klebsiella variicola]